MYVCAKCNKERFNPLLMAFLLSVCTARHQTLFGFYLIRKLTETHNLFGDSIHICEVFIIKTAVLLLTHNSYWKLYPQTLTSISQKCNKFCDIHCVSPCMISRITFWCEPKGIHSVWFVSETFLSSAYHSWPALSFSALCTGALFCWKHIWLVYSSVKSSIMLSICSFILNVSWQECGVCNYSSI
jgi:hypothetical protein